MRNLFRRLSWFRKGADIPRGNYRASLVRRVGGGRILAFNVFRSFQSPYIVIIGGLGSILGSFLGATFMTLTPIVLSLLASQLPDQMRPGPGSSSMLFGGLIIYTLIVEPRGMVALQAKAKGNLQLWPFPHRSGYLY